MAKGTEEDRTRFRDFSKLKQQVRVESTAGEHSTYFPGVSVESPISVVGDVDSAKMGMLFSIIGGMIALAFAIGRFMTSELDSDMEFLYLAIGAGLMVMFSYGFVEVQYRRHQTISIVHDYVLSFGHLFAVLGGFWLSRWGLFFYCGYYPDSGVLCNGVSGTDGWMPGEWGALVQASIFVMIGYAQWRQNERVGATILPRLVTTLAPLIVLFIGAEIWVDWANGSISLPLIISMLILTGMGMWLGSVSNRAPLFLSSAFLSSVIPIIYELKVGGGAGLTLLAIVVLMQGIFASAKGLSQPMIQRGSIGLVLIVLIAEFWAVVGDLDLVLVQPIDNLIVSLPLFLWLSLLIGYFAAVHMRRVPWMPIGLAVGLAFLPSPGSAFAWTTAIIMFVYMVTRPQTRRWVSDWTFSMLATSWFLVDWLSSSGSTFSNLELDPAFLIVPPAALLFIGAIASRHGKLSKAAHHLMVVLTLLSHEMLFGVGSYLPLIFVVYLLVLVLREASNVELVDLEDSEARKEVSVLVLVTGVSILILEWMGRLESGLGDKIGISGLGVEALMFAVVLYAIGRSLRTIEFDVGKLSGMLIDAGSTVSVWDPQTGQWSSQPSASINQRIGEWGPAMRGSMILPLLIFSLAAAGSTATWTVMLLLLPIMVLMREVLFELPQDNRTKAGGVWLLFFVGLPWSFRIHESLIDAGGSEVVPAQIMFDLIMLAGPLLGQFMLIKQGVVKEEGKAADWLLIGVMMVALLDVSGGILLLGMMFLAMTRALLHRRTIAINLLPFAWAAGILMLIQLPVAIIDSVPFSASLLTMKSSFVFGINYPAWAGIGWVIIGAIPLIGFARDLRLAKGDDAGKQEEFAQYPTLIPTLSILVGLHLLVSDPYLLVLAVVVVAGIGAWATGQLAAFWVWPPAFCFSLMFTASEHDWFGEDEVFTIASLVTWIVVILFWKGIMQSRAPEAIPGKYVAPTKDMVRFDAEAKYQGTRDILANVQLGYAVIFSLFGMIAWGGIAFLATAFLLFWRMWNQRYAKLMLAAIFLQAIAIGNTANEIGKYEFEAMGTWLVLSGLVLTWASWRMWDFEWTEKSDEEILDLTKLAGIAGAIYVPLGALFLADDIGAWLFGSVLAVFGGIQMMIGFEQDEKWRRIYTLVAIPVGILIVAGDISNGVLQGVMYLLAALTLFGQGFLYMNRAGVMVSGTAAHSTLVTENIVPANTDVTEVIDGEEPEPVEVVEEVVETISESDSVDEVLPQVEPEPVAEALQQIEPETAVPTRFHSGEGFDIELPSDVLFRIRSSLRGATYDGYKPIVKWDQHGRVILDFEALNE
ncbi:MAG: hypothetical protein CXX81_11555 [Methanobacteriota archaeon]|nr:MAG: hypothetical protein CXX81_11555 [Euryarchaeota archaeon]